MPKSIKPSAQDQHLVFSTMNCVMVPRWPAIGSWITAAPRRPYRLEREVGRWRYCLDPERGLGSPAVHRA